MKFPRSAVPVVLGGLSLLLAAPAFAQTTGTSHPEALDDTITVSTPAPATVTVTTPPPPAAPVLRERSVQQPQVYEAPATRAVSTYASAPISSPTIDPADAGIVTSVPYEANALSQGTLLRARLVGSLSTLTTRPGSRFIASLSQSVDHNGQVILPAGTSLEGRVTAVRGGKRISGRASIHLEPETLTLPDGTLYRLTAQVVDIDAGHGTHVNEEGTIIGAGHTRETVSTLGVSTGSGLVAGAAIGGPPGALVGAGIGAGVGTVLWLNQDRQQTLPEGTELVFSLNQPMTLTPVVAPAAR